jgi:hypothetical protein
VILLINFLKRILKFRMEKKIGIKRKKKKREKKKKKKNILKAN